MSQYNHNCKNPKGKTNRPLTFALAVVVGASTSSLFPCEGLVTQSTRTSHRPTSQLNYRHAGMPLPSEATLPSSVTINNIWFEDEIPRKRKLPSWLRVTREHDAKNSLEELEHAMHRSHLTKDEVSMILEALVEASSGHTDRLVGSVDFCHILLETMEMSAQTFIAAAFHFNKAFAAREGGYSPTDFWQEYEESPTDIPSIASTYGADAATIERDAARLKKAEMQASSVKADNEDLKSLFMAETRDWRALAIRCAASLYRLRGIQEAHTSNNSTHLADEEIKAAKDALYIFAPLACRLGMHRLKNEIEGTAFRILYPRQYEKATSFSTSLEGDTEIIGGDSFGARSLLDGITQNIALVLRADETFSSHAKNVRIVSRVKEPFSLWKKMLRKKTRNIKDITDTLALRVIVDAKKEDSDEDDEVTRSRERALCYYVQQLCQTYFKPMTGRLPKIKDYIREPKANGYQSLHYTAKVTNLQGDMWPVELQVRSSEMHHVAEFGLAAHWDYKLQQNRSSFPSRRQHIYDHTTRSYLLSVQDWHWTRSAMNGEAAEMLHRSDSESLSSSEEKTEQLNPYIKAFLGAKRDLERERVFVFLQSTETNGELVELPNGACIVDALRLGEEELGMRVDWRNRRPENPIVRNGSVSKITDKLSNGDVVMVPSTPP